MGFPPLWLFVFFIPHCAIRRDARESSRRGQPVCLRILADA